MYICLCVPSVWTLIWLAVGHLS
ncbi:putative L-tyrosine/L-aspartate decarboxylase [Frankliniella fusca]|uniref:L-tyrosine/L-aspartate decarboxylase n=1 Tax=Frankliniella fusca TaxID=407009 RepID=A0AAE1LFU2_9NEOP|nr:putative L-tyrosine/L-aspartate decarboxylase [Frankliniella fusca]